MNRRGLLKVVVHNKLHVDDEPIFFLSFYTFDMTVNNVCRFFRTGIKKNARAHTHALVFKRASSVNLGNLHLLPIYSYICIYIVHDVYIHCTLYDIKLYYILYIYNMYISTAAIYYKNLLSSLPTVVHIIVVYVVCIICIICRYISIHIDLCILCVIGIGCQSLAKMRS